MGICFDLIDGIGSPDTDLHFDIVLHMDSQIEGIA